MHINVSVIYADGVIGERRAFCPLNVRGIVFLLPTAFSGQKPATRLIGNGRLASEDEDVRRTTGTSSLRI